MVFSRRRGDGTGADGADGSSPQVWSRDALLDVSPDSVGSEASEIPDPSRDTPRVPDRPGSASHSGGDGQSAGSGETSDAVNGRGPDGEPPSSSDQSPPASGKKLDEILRYLEFLRNSAEERNRYDEVRELQVRKLYDELDEYKRSAQLDRMLDLARGVMLVVDKLDPSSPFPIPLDHVREELLECLASVGIEQMTAPVGGQDGLSEVVVGFFESDSPDLFRIRQEGYLIGAQVIRKRLVETKGTSPR